MSSRLNYYLFFKNNRRQQRKRPNKRTHRESKKKWSRFVNENPTTPGARRVIDGDDRLLAIADKRSAKENESMEGSTRSTAEAASTQKKNETKNTHTHAHTAKNEIVERKGLTETTEDSRSASSSFGSSDARFLCLVLSFSFFFRFAFSFLFGWWVAVGWGRKELKGMEATASAVEGKRTASPAKESAAFGARRPASSGAGPPAATRRRPPGAADRLLRDDGGRPSSESHRRPASALRSRPAASQRRRRPRGDRRWLMNEDAASWTWLMGRLPEPVL